MKKTNHRCSPRFERWIAAAAALLVMAPSVPAQCTDVSSGLQRPQGIVRSNTGSLLIAESGTRTPNSGRISIADGLGNRRTLLSGLPSGINDVGGPSGPSGLFLVGRTLYIAIGVGDVALAGPQLGTVVPNPSPSSPLFSSVLALHFSSSVENLTSGFTLTSPDRQAMAAGGKVTLSNQPGDQLQIELIANFPDYIPRPLPTVPANVVHSNPFALVAVGGRLYVTDGGMNKIWQVDLATGSFATLTTFSDIPNPLFPVLGGPFEEAVPTGITYSEGRLLVALFRGVPFAHNTSVVEEVDPATGSHRVFLSGINSAIGVLAVRLQSKLDHLVLLHASQGPFFGGTGVLLRLVSPNSPPAQVTNCLSLPTSMTLDEKTNTLYMAELGGRIVAIRIAP